MKRSENNHEILFTGKPEVTVIGIIFSAFIVLKYSLLFIFALYLYISHVIRNSFTWADFLLFISLNIIGVLLSKRAFVNLFHREIWKLKRDEISISFRFIIQYHQLIIHKSQIKRIEIVESRPGLWRIWKNEHRITIHCNEHSYQLAKGWQRECSEQVAEACLNTLNIK